MVPPLALVIAAFRARRVRTSHKCFLYSTVPRMSLIGVAADFAAWPALLIADSSSGDLPTRADVASLTSIGVGPTDARATLADLMTLFFSSSWTEAPTPATAISISFLGINLIDSIMFPVLE